MNLNPSEGKIVFSRLSWTVLLMSHSFSYGNTHTHMTHRHTQTHLLITIMYILFVDELSTFGLGGVGGFFSLLFWVVGLFLLLFSYDDYEIDGRFWILVAMRFFVYEFFFCVLVPRLFLHEQLSIKQSLRFLLVMVVLIWTWGHLGGYN